MNRNDDIISAAAYLFAKNENGEWCVLCGRRSGRSREHQGGFFDVPTGMREQGESITQTAIRETFEEAGIRLSDGDIRFIEKQPWGNGNVGSNFLGVFDECLPIGKGDFEHDFFMWILVKDVGKYKWAFGMGDKIIDLFERFVKREDNIVNEVTQKVMRKLLMELGHETYQNASSIAYDNEDDTRVKKFRKQAEKEYDKTRSRSGYLNLNHIEDFDNEKWIELNNGKKLVIFDNDYKNLKDLYDGVKRGRLLIHARGMKGKIKDDMKWIYPEFSKTLKQAYGGEYQEIARSKSEYYGRRVKTEYPELIFASDDFNWCGNTRNGVFFIESDGFQKSLGDGMIQLPNGTICKYWEGDVYDYDNELLQDEPICCEYGDWYSSRPAMVVAVMNIK